MEIPKLGYFKEKNDYTGDVGDFRYRIKPEGEILRVWTYLKWCFEHCEAHDGILAREEFPLNEEGFEQMKKWLDEECEKCIQ